ncbi:MAG: division/cell wall cluster transcriptional repressor MraZ [Lachnospiraceae bacterium]|nr:division/cell wall cluster transcriptional repressor MraZ [Lachnospiraceae bacterium]
MFIGEYNHTIDAKGRMIIPQKFREGLGESFFMSKGLDGCLVLYPEDQWIKFVDKLNNLSDIRKDNRDLKRFFLSGASDCEIDKQGRVLITPTLREYAGLKKDIVITGASTRIEVWNRNKWDDISNIDVDDMDDIAERLAEQGIDI